MKIKKVNYFMNKIRTNKPDAAAEVVGGPLAPGVSGTVSFYRVDSGTLVVAEIYNLPKSVAPTSVSPPVNPFGFHIHEGNACEIGNPRNPFMAAGGHYNPTNNPHPQHVGDMPVLYAHNGYSFLVFYTEAFKPADVVGRTIIIHQNPDDYRSQPAGNAGKRLACGVIRTVR